MRNAALATLAVVSIAACIDAFAFTSQPTAGQNFLGKSLEANITEQFIQYLSKYQKTYDTEKEFNYRLGIFTNALEIINAKNSQKEATYSLGVNYLTDWTKEEFRTLLGYKKSGLTKTLDQVASPPINLDLKNLPNKLEWGMKQGVMNKIQNQGKCGSSWAFASAAVLESRFALKTGILEKLSEQQLVDCSVGLYGNQGCNGGDMHAAFEYTKSQPLMPEKNYPYKGQDGKCQYDASKGVVNVTAVYNVPPNNDAALINALASGPVAVAIKADSDDFQYYKSGIINRAACGTELDHSVVIVGYGMNRGVERNQGPVGHQGYIGWYIVRNSWSDDWGENGYARLPMGVGQNLNVGSEDNCGILMAPVYPQIN